MFDILLNVNENCAKRYVIVDDGFGRLAQLVRASALQAGGHKFESCIAHHLYFAEIAQLVEQLTCNQ